jgi:multidrug resistance efflux pump
VLWRTPEQGSDSYFSANVFLTTRKARMMHSPPVSPVNVIQLENGSRRTFDRFDHGLEVWHKAARCHLANWSLGGLGLIVPACPWDGSEVVDLTLRVPLTDGAFPIPVRARLVHYTPTTGYAGLRFEGLSAGSYGALRYVQQCYKTGEPLALEMLHEACRAVAGNDLLLVPPSTRRSRWRWLRYAGVIALLAAVLYVLGYAVKTQIFTLTAEYAAVTTPVFELTAAADGRMEMLADLEAGQLRKGQPVARITDPDLVARIETLRAEATLQDSRIRILREQERNLSRVYARYADIAAAQSRQNQAAVAAAQALLAERQTRFSRLEKLHKDGLAPTAVLEEAQSGLLQARAAVMAAKAAQETAETNKALAAKDVLFTGSRVEGGNLQDVRRELAYAEAEAKNLRTRIAVLTARKQGLNLLSPCDCRIGRVLATPGSWVKTGTPILALHSQKPQDILIEARIPQRQADRLQVEGPVQIRLPEATTAVVSGRVSVVQRTPLSERRAGLVETLPPDVARALAPVLVRVLQPLPATAVGVPVQVTFDLLPQGMFGNALRFLYP